MPRVKRKPTRLNVEGDVGGAERGHGDNDHRAAVALQDVDPDSAEAGAAARAAKRGRVDDEAEEGESADLMVVDETVVVDDAEESQTADETPTPSSFHIQVATEPDGVDVLEIQTDVSLELDTKSIQLVVSTDRTSLIESAQDNESTGVVVQLILDTATFPVNVLSPSFGIVLSVAKLCNAGVFGLRWASNGRFIVSVLDPLPAVDFGDPPSLVGFSRRDRLKWQALSREVDVALPLTAVSVGDGAPSLQKLQTLAEVKISQEDLANQPQGLALTLRPYQRRAVSWMSRRENRTQAELHLDGNALWIEVNRLNTEEGPPLHRLMNSCVFTEARPVTNDVRGGILADEMGLGKTAEVVACVLLNPRPPATCWPLSSGYGQRGRLQAPAITHSREQVDAMAVDGDALEVTIRSREGEFECFCGGIRESEPSTRCHECGVTQHLRCSNWKHVDAADLSSFTCAGCVLADTKLQDPETGLVPIKTTLIISPAAIASQWGSEVSDKQAPGLKVLRYNGVKRDGFIRPATFGEYDVVITTYAVLRDEVYHASAPREKTGRQSVSRHSKKYPVIPSALTRVQWWRVCLDEAQMVDSSTSKPASLAARLATVNRWCVTGTPFSRGVSDLHGLLFFLGAAPFCDAKLWSTAMDMPSLHPKTNVPVVLQFLAPLLWRNTKGNVQHELPLPSQIKSTKQVGLDGIGRYYYSRLHEECAAAATSSISKHGDGDRLLSELDQSTVRRIAAPLLRLRQACSHPSLAKGNSLMAAAAGGKIRTTMSSVAGSLVDKAKTNCADSFRALVLCQNGLAALDCLAQRWGEAAERYNRVIQTSDAHRVQFEPDSMQLLHAIQNLILILERANTKSTGSPTVEGASDEAGPAVVEIVCPQPSSISSSEATISMSLDGPGDEAGRDHTIATQSLAAGHLSAPSTAERISQLRERARRETNRFSAAASVRADHAITESDKISHLVDFSSKEWVAQAFSSLGESDVAYTVVEKVLQDLASVGHDSGHVAQKIEQVHGLPGLMHVIFSELDKIEKGRSRLLQQMEKNLRQHPTTEEVAAQASCPECREEWAHDKARDRSAKRNQCVYCDACDLFIAYEPLVFKHCTWIKGEKVTQEDVESANKAVKELQTSYVYLNRKGGSGIQTQGPSETELVLQSIRTLYVKAGGKDTEGAAAFFELLKTLKQEFYALRVQWQALFERVSILDELSMCGKRIQWWPKLPNGNYVTVTAIEENLYVKPEQVEQRRITFVSDEKSYHAELQRARGRLTYLQQLERQAKEGIVLECSVCFEQLSDHYCVLPCGHCFCVGCVMPVVRANQVQVKCSMCRQPAPRALIEHVAVAAQGEGDETITVSGDHSAKISAVIRCLKQIRIADFRAKSLIFSEWGEVLDLVYAACKENGIPALRLKGSSKDDRILHQFKTDEAVAALLLPMKMGSGGLNLTEATHVLLVEPSLNPAMEKQAVGRVHRIGQTRETRVHRFVICESVEETISSMMSASDAERTVGLENVDRRSPKKRRSKSDPNGEMTISMFKNLFSLRQRGTISDGSASIGSSEAGPAATSSETDSTSMEVSDPAPTITDTLNQNFWEGVVSIRGVGYCDRAKAARTITMRKSAAGLASSAPTSTLIRDEPVVSCFGRAIHLSVAVDLLRLPASFGDQESGLAEAISRRRNELEPPCID